MPSLDDEKLVIKLLAEKGLLAERYSKTELGQGKTPDFRVFKDEALRFAINIFLN